MLLATFLAITGVIGISLFMLGFLVLRLTLTRRLKKELQPTGDYWETGTLDFGFLNTALFAWACVIPGFKKLKKIQVIYPGLDVRRYATWFERWVAYGMIGGLFVFFVCGILFEFVAP